MNRQVEKNPRIAIRGRRAAPRGGFPYTRSMSAAWQDWYHCVGNTYGSWLPGDPRGWHARKHRQHVDGDYKCPPPRGKYDTLHEHSKGLMLRDEVTLQIDHQQIVLDCLAESLAFNEIPCVVMSVSSTHAHVLARFVRGRSTSTGKLIADPARHYFGIARKRASRRLSENGSIPRGGLWSKRTTIVPITDQGHFENVVDYIQRHTEEGAVVWVNPPDAHG